MKKSEYMECEFIDIEMRFYTYEDFVKNAYAIKRLYKVLNHKLFYRWYVYSHQISIRRKNKIWEFLNEDITYEKLTKKR